MWTKVTKRVAEPAGREPLVVSLIVAAAETEVYGGERSALAMLGALNGSGYRVHVVTDGGAALRDLAAESGLAVTHVQLKTVSTSFRSGGVRGRWRKMLAFAHDWLLLRRIFSRLGADVVHVNDISPAGQIGVPAAKMARLPAVIHVRTEVRIRRLHRLMLWLADANVTVSRGVLDLHLSAIRGLAGGGRIARRAVAVHNGVDLERSGACDADGRLTARSRLAIDPEAFVVLNVGSIEPRKRQLHLLENVMPRLAAENVLADAYFVGGTKSLHQSYLSEVENARTRLADPDSCHLVGYSAGIQLYYDASDVVILGSLIEGLPRTVIEAMARGRVVAAVASPGACELIEPGRSGFLVGADDDGSEFARVLSALAAMSAAERDAMGMSGRRRLEADFDVRSVAGKFREVLDSVRRPQ